MQIIPAIDLKQGQVVRGVGGRRDLYRPVKSRLCRGASPGCVAKAFADEGLPLAYVADLDAIEGRAEPDWRSYHALMRSGLSLWIDQGLNSEQAVRQLAAFAAENPKVAAMVGGLESFSSRRDFELCLELAGAEQFVFSLDLQNGQPLARAPEWRCATAAEIARDVITAGVRRCIVLDLASVGMRGGCRATPLCRAIHAEWPQVELVSGGGVRDLGDLRALRESGCTAALVSSALHDGTISPRMLEIPGGRQIS